MGRMAVARNPWRLAGYDLLTLLWCPFHDMDFGPTVTGRGRRLLSRWNALSCSHDLKSCAGIRRWIGCTVLIDCMYDLEYIVCSDHKPGFHLNRTRSVNQTKPQPICLDSDRSWVTGSPPWLNQKSQPMWHALTEAYLYTKPRTPTNTCQERSFLRTAAITILLVTTCEWNTTRPGLCQGLIFSSHTYIFIYLLGFWWFGRRLVSAFKAAFGSKLKLHIIFPETDLVTATRETRNHSLPRSYVFSPWCAQTGYWKV